MLNNFIPITEFAQTNNISKNKAIKMLPYISDVYQCPCCKKWFVPQNTVAYYVPDKNKYNQYVRPYCYIMDAIATKTIIHQELCGLSENDCATRVEILCKNGFIEKRNGVADGSLDYLDYILSPKATDWMMKNSQDKKMLLIEILKAIKPESIVSLNFNII